MCARLRARLFVDWVNGFIMGAMLVSALVFLRLELYGWLTAVLILFAWTGADVLSGTVRQ
jgi:hypothetical protein